MKDWMIHTSYNHKTSNIGFRQNIFSGCYPVFPAISSGDEVIVMSLVFVFMQYKDHQIKNIDKNKF